MRWKTFMLALSAVLSIGAVTSFSLPSTGIDARVEPSGAPGTPSPAAASDVAANPPGNPTAMASSPLPTSTPPTPLATTPTPYPVVPPQPAVEDVMTRAGLAAVAPDPKPGPAAAATPKPTPKPAPNPKPKTQPAPRTGKDNFWYPALGIAASWSWYGCGHHWGVLGGGVFRWGCSPSSNIYILSHAWSTFAAVRHGYHSGAMQVGQTVWYSGPDGKVTQWTVKWIKHVTDAYLEATHDEWATEPSPTPIMTLQTCDGRQSQYRIIVRLVPAG